MNRSRPLFGDFTLVIAGIFALFAAASFCLPATSRAADRPNVVFIITMFLHWPGCGYVGGRDVEPITAHVDIAPTLLDICGVEKPKDITFDGVSIRPLLDESTKAADWPERMLITDSQRVKDPIKWRGSAVMSNDWRLVSNAGDGKNAKPKHEL